MCLATRLRPPEAQILLQSAGGCERQGDCHPTTHCTAPSLPAARPHALIRNAMPHHTPQPTPPHSCSAFPARVRLPATAGLHSCLTPWSEALRAGVCRPRTDSTGSDMSGRGLQVGEEGSAESRCHKRFVPQSISTLCLLRPVRPSRLGTTRCGPWRPGGTDSREDPSFAGSNGPDAGAERAPGDMPQASGMPGRGPSRPNPALPFAHEMTSLAEREGTAMTLEGGEGGNHVRRGLSCLLPGLDCRSTLV